MRVSDTLRADSIVTGVSWPDIAGAVEGLVQLLVDSGSVPPTVARPAVAAVVERERVASTAMVDIGVSIPHSRIDGLARLVTAMAVSPRGVYGASAGTPISIVFLVLSPPSLSGEHLNFLSALSMLLHSSSVRRGLQEAKTPDAVLELIRAHER